MATIKIKHNIDDIRKALKKNSKKVGFHLAIAIKKSALKVEERSKKNVPPNVDTGVMRGSITASIRPLIATIRPTVNYAVFIHEGTRFIRANPFMDKGLKDSSAFITKVFNKEIGKALK